MQMLNPVDLTNGANSKSDPSHRAGSDNEGGKFKEQFDAQSASPDSVSAESAKDVETADVSKNAEHSDGQDAPFGKLTAKKVSKIIGATHHDNSAISASAQSADAISELSDADRPMQEPPVADVKRHVGELNEQTKSLGADLAENANGTLLGLGDPEALASGKHIAATVGKIENTLSATGKDVIAQVAGVKTSQSDLQSPNIVPAKDQMEALELSKFGNTAVLYQSKLESPLAGAPILGSELEKQVARLASVNNPSTFESDTQQPLGMAGEATKVTKDAQAAISLLSKDAAVKLGHDGLDRAQSAGAQGDSGSAGAQPKQQLGINVPTHLAASIQGSQVEPFQDNAHSAPRDASSLMGPDRSTDWRAPAEATRFVGSVSQTVIPNGQFNLGAQPMSQAGRVVDEITAALLSAEPSEFVHWDVRGALTGPVGSSAPVAFAKPDMPVMISQHIASALTATPDKPIEITLNPPELGRVRMMLTASDAGVSVHIITERPETLDLMRRNIGDLGNSLSDLGYEDIAFAFAQGESSPDSSQDGSSEDHMVIGVGLDEPEKSELMAAPHLNHLSDGIDMRL